jgi:hypothetical protein
MTEKEYENTSSRPSGFTQLFLSFFGHPTVQPVISFSQPHSTHNLPMMMTEPAQHKKQPEGMMVG